MNKTLQERFNLSVASNPVVFMDIEIGGFHAGRIYFELF